jgi:hypothetical protein
MISDRPQGVINSSTVFGQPTGSAGCLLPVRRVAGLFATALLWLTSGVIAVTAVADEPVATAVPPLNALSTHRHDPIVVRSKPVIERLPVKVLQPVDLQVSARGQIFVADAQAACVFRLDSHGQVSLAVRDLPGISRIQLDRDGGLYVLTVVGAESHLYQATPEGLTVHLHTLRFPAIAFTRNSIGEFFVGQRQQLWKIGTDGQQTCITQLPSALLDLGSNPAESAVALLQNGLVCQVSADGVLAVSGQAQAGSLRLLPGIGGRFLTLARSAPQAPGESGESGESGLALYHVADRSLIKADPVDGPTLLARVPSGTEAAGLDPLGNLCLANPDLKAVTKATTRFHIPCPHCGQQTLLIFDATAPLPNDVSSF